jgi:phage terminase large subunit-like protein
MAGFDDFLAVLDDSEFEEIPVDLDTFIEDERFLGGRKMKLSPIQRECLLHMTQIYRKDTLERLRGTVEEAQHWHRKYTNNEIILMLGKGSGKDEMSAMAFTYIVYQLLCLKDPAVYYGKPSNDNIDLLNVAVNADQANRVFFKKLKNYITQSPWFEGKYETGAGREPARQGEVAFNKNINLYSGHSEREAFEGLNLFAVILDEIAAFALESAKGETGKTAEGIYKMYRASVNSRFALYGKYISLSFPRFKGDFIMQLYDRVIASKQVVRRKEIMKIDPELPDGIEGNEIAIEWEEDHIDAYVAPKIFALRRPSWDVNPIMTLEEKVSEFVSDYSDTLGRVACMPPEAVDAFFKDRNKIEDAFKWPNGVDNLDGTFTGANEPQEDKMYFVHVDLAQKHDRCAVALAHVDKWVTRKIPGTERMSDPAPEIFVDALRYWEPTKQQEVDFTEVQEYIVSLQRRGYNIKLVTFDQWRSEDMRKYLNSIGMRADLLSIKKDQYVDMAVIMNEQRLKGPDEAKLRDELLQLRLFPNGKIDHPRQGYKDLSDATCGAIFNALSRTPREYMPEIEVRTAQDYRKADRNVVPVKDNIIVAPKRKEMPPEIAAYMQSLDRMKVL